MPRYNISTPRPTRRDRAREADELALEQDRTAAANQNAMINQAVQLYGLSQARAMQPEQMRRMQLENDTMQHELQWAQPNSEARHAATMGLAGQRNDKVGMSPAEVAQLVQWGIWTPEQGREAVMTPEQKAAAAQAKAAADAERARAIAADQAQQSSTPPPPADAYAAGASSSIPEALTLGRHGLNLPATLYNTNTPWIDYIKGFLGLPDELVPAGDVYYDYMKPGLEPPVSMTRRRGEVFPKQKKGAINLPMMNYMKQ